MNNAWITTTGTPPSAEDVGTAGRDTTPQYKFSRGASLTNLGNSQTKVEEVPVEEEKTFYKNLRSMQAGA